MRTGLKLYSIKMKMNGYFGNILCLTLNKSLKNMSVFGNCVIALDDMGDKINRKILPYYFK